MLGSTVEKRDPALEAIIFDLFGVIVSFDNDIVYSRLAPHCANPRQAFGQLNGLMSRRDVITGKLTLSQIHDSLVQAHGLTLKYAEFESAWLEPYSEPMPGMAQLLGKLSSNYKLSLLSNVDRYYWEIIEASHPELEHFDSFLLSFQLGWAKPDREIYVRACEAANAQPSQCLFIDDTLANVDAARAVGLRTHWFTGLPNLLHALKAAGIKGI